MFSNFLLLDSSKVVTQSLIVCTSYKIIYIILLLIHYLMVFFTNFNISSNDINYHTRILDMSANISNATCLIVIHQI